MSFLIPPVCTNGKLPIKSKPSRLTNNDDAWTFLRGRSVRDNSFHYGTLNDKSTPADSLLFSDEKNSPHLVLYVPINQSMQEEKLLYTVSRFNFERYRLRSFHLFFLPLKEAEVLVVRSFESFDEAARYVKEVEVDTLFQADLSGGVLPLVISETNLDHLSQGAPLPRYLSFLTSTYGIPPPIDTITDWAYFSEKDSTTTEKTVPLRTQPVSAFEPEKLDESRFSKSVNDTLARANKPEELGKSSLTRCWMRCLLLLNRWNWVNLALARALMTHCVEPLNLWNIVCRIKLAPPFPP